MFNYFNLFKIIESYLILKKNKNLFVIKTIKLQYYKKYLKVNNAFLQKSDIKTRIQTYAVFFIKKI